MNERRLARHPAWRVIGRKTALGIPPDRAAGTLGVHHHGRMGARGDRGPVGVILEITCTEIPSVPAVVNQRRRTRPEVGDILVYGVELMRNRVAGELQHPAADPVLGTLQAAVFAGVSVHNTVYFIEPSGGRDCRLAQKGRQGGQRAVEAVVGPAVDRRATVVDQLPVVVGPRVGVLEIVPVGVAQRVLDRGLIGRILHGSQLMRPVDAIVRRIALRSGAIGGRTVVAAALAGPVTVAVVRIRLGTGSVGRWRSRRVCRA